MSAVSQIVSDYLARHELEWSQSAEHTFEFVLPGVQKLATPVRLVESQHSVTIQAFVCRAPDENHQAVYQWLLERNLKLFATAFAIDRLGDIFLHAKLPKSAITQDSLDQLLGSVLTAADESFNTILQLGFASSIRREWEWRISRGEPTHNLAAFRGWLEPGSPKT